MVIPEGPRNLIGDNAYGSAVPVRAQRALRSGRSLAPEIQPVIVGLVGIGSALEPAGLLCTLLLSTLSYFCIRAALVSSSNWPAASEVLKFGLEGKERRYNRGMTDHVIRVSEAEAASDFAGLLARVRAGAQVVIESGHLPVAVIHAPVPPRRSISECIALLPEDSTATIDAEFARDVEAAVEGHREPLEPPAWD